MSKVIAISNQKGGTSKSTSTINLGVSLHKKGYKVILIDLDSQGSLSISLGITEPDRLDKTICNAFEAVIEEKEIIIDDLICHHQEGIDFIPANIDLAAMDVYLVNVLGRERILNEVIEELRKKYDYILIDCMPSLGMLTINAFASANSVLIPVQAAYLSVKGLEQLIKSVGKVRRQINPKLTIEGVVITMVDQRTNYAKEIIDMLKNAYGEHLRIFKSMIPLSVRASEASAAGISIFLHEPKGKVAQSYLGLCEEVLSNE